MYLGVHRAYGWLRLIIPNFVIVIIIIIIITIITFIIIIIIVIIIVVPDKIGSRIHGVLHQDRANTRGIYIDNRTALGRPSRQKLWQYWTCFKHILFRYKVHRQGLGVA